MPGNRLVARRIHDGSRHQRRDPPRTCPPRQSWRRTAPTGTASDVGSVRPKDRIWFITCGKCTSPTSMASAMSDDRERLLRRTCCEIEDGQFREPPRRRGMVAHMDTKQPELPTDMTAPLLPELLRQAERATRPLSAWWRPPNELRPPPSAPPPQPSEPPLQPSRSPSLPTFRPTPPNPVPWTRARRPEATVNVAEKVGERATAMDTQSSARTGYQKRVDDELARGR